MCNLFSIVILFTSIATEFIPFNQEQFDNYIRNDRIVIVKFIDYDIPTLHMTIVRILINRNDIVMMQGNKFDSIKLGYHGDPFLGVFSKKTQVLMYGEYK